MTKLRAKDLPKMHHEDPSGFWKLVRTGKELPVIGQRILFVHDIRGTPDDWRRNILVNISKGDPYKITNDALERGTMPRLPRAVEALQAEVLKLPTEEYQPETRVGVVEQIKYYQALDQWEIYVEQPRGFWSPYVSPEHIVYWAPFPTAPNTYTPAPDEIGDTTAHAWRLRDFEIQERWDHRRQTRQLRQSTLE